MKCKALGCENEGDNRFHGFCFECGPQYFGQPLMDSQEHDSPIINDVKSVMATGTFEHFELCAGEFGRFGELYIVLIQQVIAMREMINFALAGGFDGWRLGHEVPARFGAYPVILEGDKNPGWIRCYWTQTGWKDEVGKSVKQNIFMWCDIKEVKVIS